MIYRKELEQLLKKLKMDIYTFSFSMGYSKAHYNESFGQDILETSRYP